MRALAGVLLAISLLTLLFTAGPELALWFASRSWQPGEATIVKVEGAAKTKDSVTWVQYRYQARGGLHESTRVFLSQRWMPAGEVLADWEKRFMLAQQQSRPMRLWISPDNPEQAVFVRELNWAAMSPLLAGCGVGIILGGIGLFWPRRARSLSTPPIIMPTTNPVNPANVSSVMIPAADEPFTLTLVQTETPPCAELQAKPGSVDVVESATLDRLDAQSILRWQDALPLHVLANKSYWHVRCALPRKGLALTQAQAHADDCWQVTFHLRCKGERLKVSLPLPAHWWRQSGTR